MCPGCSLRFFLIASLSLLGGGFCFFISVLQPPYSACETASLRFLLMLVLALLSLCLHVSPFRVRLRCDNFRRARSRHRFVSSRPLLFARVGSSIIMLYAVSFVSVEIRKAYHAYPLRTLICSSFLYFGRGYKIHFPFDCCVSWYVCITFPAMLILHFKSYWSLA